MREKEKRKNKGREKETFERDCSFGTREKGKEITRIRRTDGTEEGEREREEKED